MNENKENEEKIPDSVLDSSGKEVKAVKPNIKDKRESEFNQKL